ncbi:zinc finger protein GAI-ASSOCIATED FACTOR 1-like [Rhodamnia argentea]|uniref:Zinc finger protein GAI-ASSOCIATED FACTOR 1-like n=1 Tax=Rhodamnia argentea TaxID=178133 RepID=A0ABM3HJB7_9MYRT|nr:zinc finger protein GAI-ASSOCIATED FACTOR 1-like [Rhodamnia argentea]
MEFTQNELFILAIKKWRVGPKDELTSAYYNQTGQADPKFYSFNLNDTWFYQGFEDDELFHSANDFSQSSNGSPVMIENGGDDATPPPPTASKKRRNLPGNPDPEAEVVALSPRTLMATNRYICEVCHKGFQRDQNLQLHRRGHNLPWKLKQRPSTQAKKRVYICPEPNCVHHDPSRALGDLTGIKKHYCRKHGEKKWKCDKCSKRYAVQSDWKAHTKICGTREYRCECGTIFSSFLLSTPIHRKDSFVTHRAFCDASTEENNTMNQNLAASEGGTSQNQTQEVLNPLPGDSSSNINSMMNLSFSNEDMDIPPRPLALNSAGAVIPTIMDPFNNPRASRACMASVGGSNSLSSLGMASAYTSATALLQNAAEMGAKTSDNMISPILFRGFSGYSSGGPVNSSGSVQDGSSVVNNTDPRLYVGKHNALEMENPSTGYPVPQVGLADSALFMHDNRNAGDILGGEYYTGGGEKMTVDFLGVDPTGHSRNGVKRSPGDGGMIGLGQLTAPEGLQNLHPDW